MPRFSAEALRANQALVTLLQRLAAERRASPAQIALTWLLAQRPWIVPIPGNTKLHRLEENLGAVDVSLTAAVLAQIDAALATVEVQGDRCPVALAARAGR